jgi:bifunctional non-homologous end joining protein LigD
VGLREYQRKRDFQRTPEPPARLDAAPPVGRYVIQKHDARRLHYDLRLELDGVLLSWALPKGPSLDPKEKRLAVQTEDHPLAYGDFEGVIPEGQYGGGTVMLWDRGTWRCLGDARRSCREGTIKFEIAGQKLRGAWTLVRMTGPRNADGRNWLLIKERDAAARPEQEYSVADAEPFSVASNRTIREIAQDRQRIWTTDGPRGQAEERWRRSAGLQERADLNIAGTPGAKSAPQPATLKAVRPVAAARVPDGEAWLHELKLSGARVLAFVRSDEVRLLDEQGEDCTRAWPEVARAVGRLPVHAAVLDGLLVVTDARGAPDARALAAAAQSGRQDRVQYHVFDLPFCGGFDLRRVPLSERKALLRKLIAAGEADAKALHYADHIVGNGDAVFAQAARLGAAGIVSKRADSPYPGKPSKAWQVVDCPATAAPGTETPAADAAAARGVAALAGEPRATVCGVRLTNPDRILYPEDRVTKRMLAHYYEAVADRMLPHVAKRPLSLFRAPEGLENESFFQKHVGEASIAHLRDSPVREGEGKDPYIAIDDVRGLITLAQLSVLEIHPWGSREDDVDRPDRLIFDLDPGPDVGWRQVVGAARAVRDLLADLGLRSFAKTSGGKGIHVVVPITRRGGWDEIKDFCGGVAKVLAAREPKRYVATMAKWARQGRVFIDFLRNVRGATAVAAYSTRARPGAPVSAPVFWDELDAHPIGFTLHSLPRRIVNLRRDPWEDFPSCRQSVTKAAQGRLARWLRESRTGG